MEAFRIARLSFELEALPRNSVSSYKLLHAPASFWRFLRKNPHALAHGDQYTCRPAARSGKGEGPFGIEKFSCAGKRAGKWKAAAGQPEGLEPFLQRHPVEPSGHENQRGKS